MFKLQDGREHLYQWDINRRVIVEDPTIDEVHFCNKTDDCSLVVKTYTDDTYDGKVYADIPNILLQNDFPIRVYAYCNDGYTKIEECFKVKSRTKPSDYVYEETTVIRIDTLIDKAEEAITTASELTEYFDTHKLDFTDDGEGNVTLEGVIPEGGGGGDVDLSNYYTKEETDTAISTAIADLDIPDVTGFAKLEDIPTIPTNVSSFNNDAGYLTEHQSLTNYYTRGETDVAIEEAIEDIEVDISGKADLVHQHSIADITDYVAPDLSEYAKLTDIPDVSKYQTADQVTALINDALSGIATAEGGSY